MEAIILAGGLGTRLRDVIKDIPKPMADISGRPFLSYVLDYASSQGVEKVLLSVGYKHEVIQAYFGTKHRGMGLEYVIEEEQLGTGGAIREALKQAQSEQVIVLNGDTFFAVDYQRLMQFHLGKNADLSMALKPMNGVDRYGTVIIGPDNRITGFREKKFQKSGMINGGVYVVNKARMDALAGLGKTFSFESDFLQKQTGRLAAYALVCEDYFIDIGIRLDYKKAQAELPRIVLERNV